MTTMKMTLMGSAMVLLSGGVAAACPIESGRISILSNEFGALRAVNSAAQECAGPSVDFAKNETTEHRDLQVAAMKANPAEYTAAVVANSSIVPLMNEGLIRPLDDLIAEHAPDLPSLNQVSVGGNVMAIAFMANAQHLYVRTDILEEVGMEMPTSYEDVIAFAEAVKEAGIMEHPFASNFQTGWNLGEEFINMYLGHGGAFFEDGSAAVSINNEAGIASLEMMKRLSELSNPDFLTFDSNATQALWEAGDLAIAYMWGSRGGGMLDDEGSTPEVVENTKLVAAPTVGGGDVPASTLWWDGFTIAQNISDEDAAATFRAMVAGIGPETVEANQTEAVWLSPAYTPGPGAEGVSATAQAGAKPYPMLPYMGLLHTALGNELSGFLQGQESAEQALSDVEAAYTEAAKEQGFLQ